MLQNTYKRYQSDVKNIFHLGGWCIGCFRKKIMKVINLIVGQLKTNCYLVFDKETRVCLIIDPGDDVDYIMKIIADEKLKPVKIIATHGHFDHILAVTELKLAYNIPFLMHKDDEFLLERMNSSVKFFLGVNSKIPIPKVDEYLENGDSLQIANCELKIVSTPGHTPGGITLYCKKEKLAFVGDLVFAGGAVGRTDFAYSSHEDLQKSIEKILKLPGDTKLYCGHGEVTTIFEFKKDF